MAASVSAVLAAGAALQLTPVRSFCLELKCNFRLQIVEQTLSVDAMKCFFPPFVLVSGAWLSR